jgi:riboflavin biosynthesis pyrimidine reductase
VTRSGDLPPKVLAADPILIDDPATARDRLADLGLARVLCEGGPHILGALTAADQVDELFLTLSPLLAGPGAGRITAGPASPPRQLRLRHILTDGELLYMRFSRDRQGR